MLNALFSIRMGSFALVILFICVFAGIRGPQAEADSARDFDIPAQPLALALLAFSEQAGLQILVASDHTDNEVSTGVAGRYVPALALGKLLESTPLRYRLVADSTIAIVPDGHGFPAADEPPSLMPAVWSPSTGAH